ncbi:hypothetical protein PR202_gb08220 [Eleusine coracana subsp. coracana]|uniref:VWFA domain-containing protein n=1 Tax=Eleusine coracana subsp. coracana TaxID=191504 RepID=A0AAV5EEL0_ELECO|nr:hypothetical protein QOZ80_2BG0182640 [Eleusine coracana subsp. coracana]GJN20798.1 hypothetical protein PR202_gb08220 [Eleusine coracana subsp. coracana]
MESSPRSSGHGHSRRSRSSRSRGSDSSSSSSGKSLFTAECSQELHPHRSASAGTSLRELLSLRSTNLSQHQPPSSSPAQPFFRPVEPRVFDDDDPVERTPRLFRGDDASSGGEAVTITTHCEYSALARDASADDFAVLVHARAPGAGAAGPRAPLDLVTVLDVSGSMVGTKLALLKQGMEFVIDNLGPRDRLCVISFSSGACRLMRLARMSDAGKALARRAVGSLAAGGGTNIGEALRKAAKVVDDRVHSNAVASVVLLSDGQDTYTAPSRPGRHADYDALVPPSLERTSAGRGAAPVHTFGLGADHDAAAMHTVAEATGGTFSFVEEEAAIQDAFAQCIGGLLSVAVQDLRVDVECAHPGVRVSAVRSGNYTSRVDVDGRATSVDVGELYADEERRFLLFLHVPRSRAVDDDVTRLVSVSCSYSDTATGRAKHVTGDDAVVRRPHRAEAETVERSVEVERERVRVEAMDGMAAARVAAERGAHAEAVEILRSRRRAVTRSGAARHGDATCAALARELREMRARVADRWCYEQSGRAYVLAGLSSHAQQRATSTQVFTPGRGDDYSVVLATEGAGGTTSYMTPAMLDMLDRSRCHQRQHQQTKERGRTTF